VCVTWFVKDVQELSCPILLLF